MPRMSLVRPSLALMFSTFVAGGAVALGVAAALPAQDAAKPAGPTQEEMAKAMAAAAKFTKPSAAHKELNRFLGTWTTTTSFVMAGRKLPGEKGTSTISWLMPDRWLKIELGGAMMGRNYTGLVIMGYDNFKMSYVSTSVTSIDTAMVRLEGDMDPSGKVMILYGTLDEYTTGEHDKMVKYVYRFESEDRIRLEVHDLPIGENNTQVVEVLFERVKDGAQK